MFFENDSQKHLPPFATTLKPLFIVAIAVAVFVATRVLSAPTSNGHLLFSNNTTTPQHRTYSAASNTFTAATNPPAGAGQTWMVLRSAPTRDEQLAGYVTTGGVLYVLRWNGSAWSAEWNVTVGGAGVNGRRFDIAYEKTLGRALVVYSTNTTGTNELAYRIWDGAAWSAATPFDSLRLTGTANAIKLAPRVAAGSNEIAMAVADTNSDLTAMSWSGSGWVMEPAAAISAAVQLTLAAGDNDNFDLAWASSTGNDLFVIWSDTVPQQYSIRYTRTNATSGTWAAATSWGTGRSAPLQMIAVPDPNSDNILFAFNRGASTSIYARFWNGTALTTVATPTGTGIAPAANRRTIAGGWLTSGAAKVAILFWMNNAAANNRIDYNYSTDVSTFSTSQSFTFTGTSPGEKRWMDFVADPFGADTGMLTFSDANNDLWARRLVYGGGTTFTWTNADGGNALTTTLANNTTENFSFDYDRQVPTTTIATGTDPAGSSICPPAVASPIVAGSFTLKTNTGSDSVTALNVSLGTNAWPGVATVQITNDAETTIYGSATPAADTVAITLSTALPVSTTLTQFHIRIIPFSALTMPAAPGANYTVSARISSFTSSLAQAGSDTAGTSIAIDNSSPADAAWGSNTAGNGQVVLNWTNPALDFAQVLIIRKTTSPILDAPAEGTLYTAPGTLGTSTIVYAGSLQTFTDNSVVNGTTYYYKIFARDACGNYSGGVQSGPFLPAAPVASLTTQSPSASVDSCTQITVSAPFAGDTGTPNSTTTFERATAIAGPYTPICSGVTGPTPRSCIAAPLTAGTTYYFRVTFTDPDGVSGQNPQIAGPYTTPACPAAAPTAVGTATALVSSCKQITVTAPFTGDGNENGSAKVEFNTTNTWPGTTACTSLTGGSPRQCLVTGLTASTAYYLRVTFSDADGVSGTNPQILGPFTTPACAADSVPPMVLFLAPARNAVLGGTDRVKVQVWDSGALATANPVQWSIDGAALSAAGVAANANYSCGGGCTVYEFNVDTSALSNGPHSINVQATDAASNAGRASIPFNVNTNGTTPKGSGENLRRTYGSQLCIDCHALATHSSQMTSTKYGNWAIDCLTCHTPHDTQNIELIRRQIETPNSGTNTLEFRANDKAGGSEPQYSHLGDYSGLNNTPYTDGICETCHTKTNHYRNDASGGDHTHNQSTRCIGCHQHEKGFAAAESVGGYRCQSCHPAIWNGMTGGVAKTTKHTLGNVLGTNDSFTDTAIVWGNPLGANAISARSCVNMCHQDHTHNNPGGSTHDYNVHQDASTQPLRAVTRDGAGNITGGTPARTDFNNAVASGGMCLSCHKNPVDAAHPAIVQSAFNTSVHNYTTFSTYGAWQYTLHDGSAFDRNCTKCHADPADTRPGDSGVPFGAVHYSDNPSLLAGSFNPNNAPASFVCYVCHGNGTTGTNYSGKNIASLMAKARAHPSNADNVHNTVTEFNNAAWGNSLGNPTRHANCVDCHAPHEARSGLHTAQSNTAGAALQGAWGAKLSTLPARWAVPAAANFTKVTITPGTDAEATLCFKCHSSYYWGGTVTPPTTSPISPSSSPAFNETDQAQEFNPNNTSTGATAGSFHPVLASAGSNLGATSNIKAPWTLTSLMTCTDCHASDTVTDPGGPHGSAAGFLLKGPNTTWNATLANTSTGMPNGTFCINCHNQDFTNSRYSTLADGHRKSTHLVACWSCHAAIPHGTARPGLLVAIDSTIYGSKDTDKAPYRQMPNLADGLYIVSYPANNTTNWGQSNCGCGGSGH